MGLSTSSDQVLAGVCGGLANEFGIDATLMRVLYVIGTLLTGLLPGLVVYLILYLVMD